MGLLRKKFVKNGIKIYQKSIIIKYGHEKRFYKILKIRFFKIWLRRMQAFLHEVYPTTTIKQLNKSKIG